MSENASGGRMASMALLEGWLCLCTTLFWCNSNCLWHFLAPAWNNPFLHHIIKLQSRVNIGERCGLLATYATVTVRLAETFRVSFISCDASFMDETAQRQLHPLFQCFGIFSAFMYDSCPQHLTLCLQKVARPLKFASFLRPSYRTTIKPKEHHPLSSACIYPQHRLNLRHPKSSNSWVGTPCSVNLSYH